MKLFDKIPAAFFSVLASPNRELYWTALVTLHNQLRYSLNVPVEDYRTALGDTLADMELASVEELGEEEREMIRQPNGKVSLIINRLLRAGWLDKEYRDGTFEEVIAPRDYADQMIRLLLDLEAFESKEYNSLVYATYSGLKQAYVEESDRVYEALQAARRNTSELLNDLKSLYHNIRYYHQSIGEALDVNRLLHDYYDEYKSLLDRVYHPIKTMDSIPLYREPIIDILNGISLSDELLEKAENRMCKVQEGLDRETAREQLMQDINFLLQSYTSVDEILQEIDRKHRAYTRESADSIKYRMSADHGIKGKLAKLLTCCAGAAPGKEQAQVIAVLQGGIQCESQMFADGTSLWHPTVRSRRPGAPALPVEDVPPEDEQALLAGLQKDLKHQYSILRARNFIQKRIGEHPAVTTDEIELDEDAQFILMLIATVRATDQNSPFEVEFLEGQTEKNGYSVPRMRFWKKGMRHVE